MKKFWTEEEINYLKNNYKILTYKEIALKLKRTKNSISKKLERLELDNKIKFSTEDEWICKCGKYKDRRAKICKACWNKLPKSEASNKKRSLSLKGKRKPEGFNIGHNVSKETKLKISKSNIGKTRTEETKQKIREDSLKHPRKYWLGKKGVWTNSGRTHFKKNDPRITGENNHNWNGGNSKNRKYSQDEWIKLRKKIYERDNHTCQLCNTKSELLHAHHKLEWSRYPELALDPNNLITLCNKCHAKVHTLIKFYKNNHAEKGFDTIFNEIKKKLVLVV
jgi:hypothetical protein